MLQIAMMYINKTNHYQEFIKYKWIHNLHKPPWRLPVWPLVGLCSNPGASMGTQPTTSIKDGPNMKMDLELQVRYYIGNENVLGERSLGRKHLGRKTSWEWKIFGDENVSELNIVSKNSEFISFTSRKRTLVGSQKYLSVDQSPKCQDPATDYPRKFLWWDCHSYVWRFFIDRSGIFFIIHTMVKMYTNSNANFSF